MSYKFFENATQVAELVFVKGHFYIRLDGSDWLLDTGAPSSFGITQSIVINDKEFGLQRDYLGLDAKQISMLTKHKVFGLIGVDILNQFYVVIDYENRQIAFSDKDITMSGSALDMRDFMGIPIVNAGIDGADKNLFFDTGAQISYWHDQSLKDCQSIDMMEDFYPGFGKFKTDVYLVNMILGDEEFPMRCGVLPSVLQMSLSMGNTEGILGNELLKDTAVGYFPKKNQLVIS